MRATSSSVIAHGQRHLSQEVGGTLPRIVKNIEGLPGASCARTGSAPWGAVGFDDSKVTDHTPSSHRHLTAKAISRWRRKDLRSDLPASPQRWQDDHIGSVTTVITAITNGDLTDAITRQELRCSSQAWKVLDLSV